MFKILGFFVLLLANKCFSAQWITLSAKDIENIQIIQSNNSHGAPEGLYIGLKAEITGEAATYCSKKDFVAISDSKLIDRAYSGLMFSISTQKSVRLYINGSGSCLSNG